MDKIVHVIGKINGIENVSFRVLVPKNASMVDIVHKAIKVKYPDFFTAEKAMSYQTKRGDVMFIEDMTSHGLINNKKDIRRYHNAKIKTIIETGGINLPK